jgi:aconitate hydratase
MAPEYGATTGFWPVDEQTITYLRITGRSAEHVALVEAHARAAGLFRWPVRRIRCYDRVIAFDLGKVRRTIAGPHAAYPTDTSGVAASFRERAKGAAVANRKHPTRSPKAPLGLRRSPPARIRPIRTDDLRRARCQGRGRRGLKSAPWVKTSLAPGSRAVTTYLDRAGLLAPLEALGFGVIGYGCTTCAGKSGPLKPLAPGPWSRTAAPLRLSSRATAISMGASTVKWVQTIFARPRWWSPSRWPGA